VKSPRFGWLDILRAFGVLGVVIVHASSPAWLSGLITPWYLGVFFFASGYTYKDEYTTHPWTLAKKRFFSLYVPLVCWQMAYMLLHNVFFDMSILSDKVGYLSSVSHRYTLPDFLGTTRAILTMRGGEDMGGALWFVVALISVNALFCLVSVANKRLAGDREWGRLVMVLALAAIGSTNQTLVRYPPYLNLALLCVSLFYAGYLYRRYETRVPMGLAPFALAAVVLFLGRGTALSLTLTGNPVVTVAIVLAGVYLVLMLSKAIASQRLLEYIGRNSLTIIATQFLAFKLVSLVIIRVQGLPAYELAAFPVITGEHGWWLAYAVVGVLVPVAAKLAFDTVKRRIASGTATPRVGGA
jgi:fucose 4-O-acetylase-like acetyltransferase